MGTKYAAKILRVELDTLKTSIEDVGESTLRKYIGGSGVGAKILWEETSASTEPFSPENRLIFTIGPISGKAPQSSRFIVCALSPANEAWGEATAGGHWATELSRTGFSGLIISGRAPKPVYLYINNEEIEIRDATHLWGKDTYEVSDLIQGETGRKVSVAAIGRAGEKLVRLAGIISDGRSGRAAARCGMGAVMGSKNLKAVAVRGTRKAWVFDETRLKILNKAVTQLLSQIQAGVFGPAPNMKISTEQFNQMGNIPVKNQSEGRSDSWVRRYLESFEEGKAYRCALCPVGCFESHMLDGGRQMVAQFYFSMGSNCLIDNFEVLQQAYELCNRYGIDGTSAGYCLAFAIELFSRGIISKEDTGGIELTWGNHEAMLELVKQIGEAERFGKVLGQGVKRAAEQIGGEASRYALHVKGLEIPLWEPRVFNSLMIGYATANRGASHMESPSYALERKRPGANYGPDLAQLGYPRGAVNQFGLEAKADLVKTAQDLAALINSLVLCHFSVFIYGVPIDNLSQWLNSVTGWDTNLEELMKTGERIFNLKRLINLRHGLTAADDKLPERFFVQPPRLEGLWNVPTSVEKHLQEYYSLRGWSNEGVPTQEKLAALGLYN